MNYYQLKPGLDLTEIGTFPQSIKMTNNYIIDKADSIWETDIHSDIPPDLDGIQLDKLAKTTDLLSVVVISSIHGLVISESFKKVMSNLLLPPHRFFEAKVYDHRGNEVQKKYYLFRLLKFQNDWIDLDNSVFVVSKKGGNEMMKVNIGSIKEFMDLPRDITRDMHPKKISLKPDLQFDIFYLNKIGGYFCSKGFKNAIEAAEITGVRFESVDYLSKEVLQKNETS